MKQIDSPVMTTPKSATPTPSKFTAGSAKAAVLPNGAETKLQPAQTRAVQRTVRFELVDPNAWSVSVVGAFNGWKAGATPLISLGGGKWARELSLAPGRYEYRFVVNDQWEDDPKAKAYVSRPHGGRNAVLEVE